MTAAFNAKSNGNQGALQINGADVVVFDATGIISGIAPAIITPAMLTTAAVPLGVNQTWQNVTASRVLGTTYYNTTGRPIEIAIASSQGGSGTINITVAGIALGTTSVPTYPSTHFQGAVVPVGASYVVAGTNTLTAWSELR